MDEHLARVEARLREIDEALARMCARVDALEHRSRAEGAGALEPASVAGAGHALPALAGDGTGGLPILTLAGRTFLVLGGAYLLRALTDTGMLSPTSGVALGLTYASTWIGAADRAARHRPASGVFHGLASLLIGCPLLLEASTRFGVLSPNAAAACLAALVAVAFGVAWHRGLEALAGLAAIAGSLTAIVLSLTTGQFIPFALVAILAAAVAEASRIRRAWAWPERVAALAAVVLVLEAVAAAHGSVRPEPPGAVLATALILAALYVAVLTISAAAKEVDLSLAEAGLWLVPIVVGVAGALSVARLIGPATVQWLGGVFLALGIAGYVVSVTSGAWWSNRGVAVLTSIACAMLIVGVFTSLPERSMDVLGGVLGVGLLAAGARAGQVWLTAQGLCLILVAAASSRLLGLIGDVWIAALPSSPPLPTAIFALLAALAGGLVLPRWISHPPGLARAASLILTTIAAFGTGALLVVVLTRLDGLPGSAGLIAAERSAVLAALAVVLAALAGQRRSSELRWVAYAFIGLGALKLALEDMRVSSPLAVFFALAAYGAALIAVSRLLGRKRGRA